MAQRKTPAITETTEVPHADRQSVLAYRVVQLTNNMKSAPWT